MLVLRVGDLTLELANHEVYHGTRIIELSARELVLLKVLMREPGRVFTRAELCESVWEHPHEYETKLVEVFIGRLRKKNRRPSAHSYRAACRLYSPGTVMKHRPVRRKLADWSKRLAANKWGWP
jgi:DNA-binding response OmpR family regulator